MSEYKKNGQKELYQMQENKPIYKGNLKSFL